jgi:hypothetical protein
MATRVIRIDDDRTRFRLLQYVFSVRVVPLRLEPLSIGWALPTIPAEDAALHKWRASAGCGLFGRTQERYTVLVHNGVMKVAEKPVRQSVSLPPRLAKQVGSMAKSRKLSKNRMLLELIENGIDAEKRKQQEFFALAERFRNEQDPEAANRLGDELGRMVFGG